VVFGDTLPFTFASPRVDLSSSATSMRLNMSDVGSYVSTARTSRVI
jgi:hypothetical protein